MSGSASSSRQHSSSESASLGLGYGYSGNESLSDSLSRARSGGQSTSSQAIAFEDLFSQLYTGATGAAGRAAAMQPGLTQQANQLFSGGLSFLDNLQGGPGAEYLEGRVTGANGELDAQIGNLGGDLGRFLREEINPALVSRGVATGTLGGGRQGVAQGAAARGVAEEFTQGATALRVADRASRDAGASNLMTARTGAIGTGLAALPGLFDIAGGSFESIVAPYQALGSIFGGPMALTTGQSTNFSESDAIAQAISRAFAENFSFDTSSSSSQSKGKSMAISGSFGGGGGSS